MKSKELIKNEGNLLFFFNILIRDNLFEKMNKNKRISIQFNFFFFFHKEI